MQNRIITPKKWRQKRSTARTANFSAAC